MIRKLMFIACIGLIGLMGCDGDKGDVGPAGPKGDTGAAGPAGADGEDGENGIGAMSITSAANVKSTNGGYVIGTSRLSAADSATIASGVTVVFIRSGDRWYSVPGKVMFGDQWTGYDFNTTIQNSIFYVIVKAQAWSEGGDTAPERTFGAVRAVIIPATAMRMNASVNLKDYNSVVSAFGLKESDFKEVK